MQAVLTSASSEPEKEWLKAWAIRRMPAEDQWDGELVKEMQGTPQRPALNVEIADQASNPGQG